MTRPDHEEAAGPGEATAGRTEPAAHPAEPGDLVAAAVAAARRISHAHLVTPQMVRDALPTWQHISSHWWYEGAARRVAAAL